MHSEIGSEFWNVPTGNRDNGFFPLNIQWYLSGRSALQAIVKDLKHSTSVAMPSWCCDSMIKPFTDAGFSVCFYPVWFDNGIRQEPRYDCDVLFLLDYFGYTSATKGLSEYKGIVIRDITHSVFSSSYTDADYYFGSLRKWCGIWTGGYAWTKDKHKLLIRNSNDQGYTALREQAMELKRKYITGEIDEKGYLKLFDKAEDILENIGVSPASERDVQQANHLNITQIKSRHRENAEVLRKAFSEWLVFHEIKGTDCPMFVPVMVPDGKRNELRQYLIQNSIYCPIHWPVTQYHKLNDNERFIYDNELSLVCDQRYTPDDMNRMVKTIKRFMEE